MYLKTHFIINLSNRNKDPALKAQAPKGMVE
jgi:hypothetical protein